MDVKSVNTLMGCMLFSARRLLHQPKLGYYSILYCIKKYTFEYLADAPPPVPK